MGGGLVVGNMSVLLHISNVEPCLHKGRGLIKSFRGIIQDLVLFEGSGTRIFYHEGKRAA